MADTDQYFWVVLCKNHRFHSRQSLFYTHKIPLAETDAYLPLPSFDVPLNVRCDDCGQEYSYQPKEILRAQLPLIGEFAPHPMFRRAATFLCRPELRRPS